MDHIDLFFKEKNTEAFYNTKGYKKLINFVVDLVKKDKFSKFAQTARKKYGIPQDGFKLAESPSLWIPEKWAHRKDRVKLENMRKEITTFCKPYRLPARDWMSVFEGYIFYNKVMIPTEHNAYNLCYVTDVSTKRDSQGREMSKDTINAFPIGLLISPYASERDIKNYIEKIYTTEIEPLQKNYNVSGLSFTIGKSKTKKSVTQERNDFIYKKRNLPLKDISALLRENGFEIMDEGHIAAIISQGTKKKKEV